jgi:hypothetical protein
MRGSSVERVTPPGEVPRVRSRLLPPLRSAQELVSGLYSHPHEPNVDQHATGVDRSPSAVSEDTRVAAKRRNGATRVSVSTAAYNSRVRAPPQQQHAQGTISLAARRLQTAIWAHVVACRHHSILSKLKAGAAKHQLISDNLSATKLPHQELSTRELLRQDTRERNRAAWAPVSELIWTLPNVEAADSHAELSRLARGCVFVHGLFFLVTLWDSYAFFVLQWETRVEWSFLPVFSLGSCVMLRATVHTSHPERGELPHMCSFFAFASADIKHCQTSRRRFAAVAAIISAGIALQLLWWLNLFFSGRIDSYGSEIRFAADGVSYGGHSGNAAVVACAVTELLCTMIILPWVLLFICTLSTASWVAAKGADRLVVKIDDIDNDEEVSSELRSSKPYHPLMPNS